MMHGVMCIYCFHSPLTKHPIWQGWELYIQTVIQPCIWFMEDPSQFALGQTAKSVTCSINEKPLTGLSDCLKILLSPSSYWMSGYYPLVKYLFRLLYLNFLVLSHEEILKRVFTFSGIALSCFFAAGHVMEYTVRTANPERMFHYHYCAKVQRYRQISIQKVISEPFSFWFLPCQ